MRRNRRQQLPTNLEKWHEREIAKIKKENEYQKLLNEQKELRNKYKRKIKLSTSKTFMLLIFLNCTAIEIFSAYITYKAMMVTMTVDMSALVALIGAVVGESLSFLIYCNKAARENTRGGITYETAIRQMDATQYGCENNSDADNIYDETQSQG